MREATVALEPISRMKSAMPVESDDSLLSLYLADTFLAFISTCLQLWKHCFVFTADIYFIPLRTTEKVTHT